MAEQRGVGRFVFASSCSIYGAAEGRPKRESDQLNPLTAYARSKVAMENALRASNAGEMTVTCLRFATACGMSDRLRLDLVLNDFVASALATGEITVLSDGTPWRPLIDVSDMARAIEWAIGRDTDRGGRVLVVNAGSNAGNYQVRDLAQVVAAELPGTRVSINTAAPPDLRSYQVDFSLFAELAPAHLPAVPLAVVLVLCAALYRGQDWARGALLAPIAFRVWRVVPLIAAAWGLGRTGTALFLTFIILAELFAALILLDSYFARRQTRITSG